MRFSLFAAAVLSLVAILPMPVGATVLGVETGNLIKLQNDHDPRTIEDGVVYYLDRDWRRRPFPNQRVFETWYKDFNGVLELSKEDMAEFRMGGSATFRPGGRLVKIPSVPKVYAVEPGGVLRWIVSEEVAVALYGAAWNKRVEDVPESYFGAYREGTPLTVASWPTGTVVRRASDTALFLIEGLGKHYVSPSVAASTRINMGDVVDTTSDLSRYADYDPIREADRRIVDIAQLSFFDTPSAAQVDSPAQPTTLARGADRTLAKIRFASGKPLILRGIGARLTGELWKDGQPMLKNLHFVDASGNDAFGIRQLEHFASTSDVISFAGAATAKAELEQVFELRADVAENATVGGKITVRIERSGLVLGDGTNGNALRDFAAPAEFAEATLTIQ